MSRAKARWTPSEEELLSVLRLTVPAIVDRGGIQLFTASDVSSLETSVLHMLDAMLQGASEHVGKTTPSWRTQHATINIIKRPFSSTFPSNFSTFWSLFQMEFVKSKSCFRSLETSTINSILLLIVPLSICAITVDYQY